MVNEYATEGSTLLHSTRQLPRIRFGEFRHADHFQKLIGFRNIVLFVQAKDFDRQKNVFNRCPPREHDRLLEHHADVSAWLCHLFAGDRDLSLGCFQQTAHDVEGCRLTATTGTQEGEKLPLPGLKVEAAERNDFIAARLILLRDTLQSHQYIGIVFLWHFSGLSFLLVSSSLRLIQPEHGRSHWQH